jgi:hypothetical protein
MLTLSNENSKTLPNSFDAPGGGRPKAQSLGACHMKSRQFVAGVVAGASMLLMAGVTQAAIIESGNIDVILGNPQPTETAINLNNDNSGTTNVGTGVPATVGGIPIITFQTDVNATFASGNATIKPASGTIGSLTFSVPTGFFFTDIEFGAQGSDHITITAFNGLNVVGTYSNDDVLQGANGLEAFLTLATNGALFTSIVIASDLGFTELKQFAISGLVSCGPTGSGCAPVPNAVPLPGALPLFAAGAGLLGFLGWRRKKRIA